MTSLRVCLDVSDLDAGIQFYERALGLKLARRLGSAWAELSGTATPIDLLAKPAGSRASPGAPATRDYARHWTPVHLDFAVADIAQAVKRATNAGATLEAGISRHAWGAIAGLADPFGHGFCLIEFTRGGYDEMPGVERSP
ncbi:MAG TPA: VOC family protein [Gammaproteobacteria bacterium]|nr:VOC family protein [Gammaproteobacteria bacterium]